MVYYRAPSSLYYIVVDNTNKPHTYGSLSLLRLDWPFAKRICAGVVERDGTRTVINP